MATKKHSAPDDASTGATEVSRDAKGEKSSAARTAAGAGEDAKATKRDDAPRSHGRAAKIEADRTGSKIRTSRTAERTETLEDTVTPLWYKIIMFGLMLIGFVWIITSSITGGAWPVPMLGAANMWVGLGIVMVGFIMTTGWK